MLTDQIWQEMTSENLTGIDDIESIRIDGPSLRRLQSEYRELFDEVADAKVLEEYFGSRIEVTDLPINGGYEIERSF